MHRPNGQVQFGQRLELAALSPTVSLKLASVEVCAPGAFRVGRVRGSASAGAPFYFNPSVSFGTQRCFPNSAIYCGAGWPLLFHCR
jgi:hypothetical protein